MGILVIDTHFIVEDSVETDVLESGGAAHHVQIATVAIAQGKNRSSRTEHLLPEMRERCDRRIGIELNRLRPGRRCLANTDRRKQARKKQRWQQTLRFR